jgi:hypothetical protein
LFAGVHYHFIAAPLSLLGGSELCPEEGLVIEVNFRVVFALPTISGSIASGGEGEGDRGRRGREMR